MSAKRIRRAGKKQPRLPKCAVVEQAVLSVLLLCSPDAIRIYLTLCRFARKTDGWAYPTRACIARNVGLVPYNTDANTGAIVKALTKSQRETRNKQIARFNCCLELSLDELVRAGLIARAERYKRAEDGTPTIFGYFVLRLNGSRRNLLQLRYRGATFVIPGNLFDKGVFAIRSARTRFKPIDDEFVRPLLLALRDNDLLRFGGIDPSKASTADNQTIINRDGWPSEMPFSLTQFRSMFDCLIKRGLMRTHGGIFSATTGHLVSSSQRQPVAGEVALEVFAFC